MSGTKTTADLAADLQDIEVVMIRTSLSRATIYRRVAQSTFPKQRKMGARTVWAKADIDRFCAEVIGDESMGDCMGQDMAA
ncbi:helix-turn-helix transcriptional regulator [Stenotrophomonas indicatrix]|uniref:helix-turn-helix transcriptional regulator n=1 Tax=Stenotrophomonas indicatrix TaxID=2045451 RepID=UPI00320ABB20